MAAATTEITISGAGQFCLLLRDCLQNNTRFSQQIVEATARNRITARINDDRCL